MKYLLLVLFVFGFFGGVLGQNEKQQSIDFWKKVNEFDSDTAKIGFINDIEDRRSYLQNPKLAEEILNFALQAKTKIKEKRYKGLLYKIIMYTHLFKMDFSTTITYADSALLFLEGKDRQLPLFEKGQCFMYTGQTNEAKAIFNSLLNDKDLPSRSKFLIARLFAVSKIREGDYDSAYIFLDKMEQIYIKDKEEEYYAATLDVRTMLYTQNRHYDSALISLRKMEEYKIKTQGKDDLGRIYGNMGNIYRDYGKQDLAEEYYQKSLAIKEEYGGKDLGFTYHALSSLYRDKGENEKAISYLKQAISAYEKVEDLEGIAFSKEHLGFYQAELRFNQGATNFDEEIQIEEDAYTFFKQQNTVIRILGSGSYLCTIYLYANKIEKAQSLIKELKKYEGLSIDTDIRLHFTDIKVKLASKGLDMKFIDEITKQDINHLLTLQDSVAFLKYDKEIPRRLAEAETQRVKQEKREQELKNQLTQEQLATSRTQSAAIGTVAFVLLLGGIIISVLFVKNKRKNVLLEEQKEEIETQNQELTTNNEEILAQKEVIQVANKKLETANKDLETANAEITWLKRSLEHDLKNDLSAMRDVAEVNISKLKSQEDFNDIENKQSRLLATVDYYAFMTKISKEKKDVKDLLFYLVTNLLEKYGKGEFIQVNTQSNLDVKEELDRYTTHKIVHCIVELVRNTLKYAFPADFSEKQDRKPTINLEVIKENEQFFMRYKDNGIGMQKEDRGEGFELLKEYSHPEDFVWQNGEEGGVFVQLRLRIEKSKKQNKQNND